MTRKTYQPRAGTVAARAIAVLRRGPMRQILLAERLKIDRRTLFMCMRAPIKHGLVITFRGRSEEKGGIEVDYSLSKLSTTVRSIYRHRDSSTRQPTREAMRWAKPFGDLTPSIQAASTVAVSKAG